MTTKGKAGEPPKNAAGTSPTANSRTMKGLGSMNLTDLLHRGTTVPGVADQAPSPAEQSLYQIQEVSIDDILESDYQMRETVDPERFRRLVQSMKEQKPTEFKDLIPVRPHPTEAGKWQVARGGHTRLKAAKEAGLKTYPITIVSYDNKRSALATVRENLARADELTPVEEGRSYLVLKEEFGYTQEDMAHELGISRDRIKECMAAAQSAPDILEMFGRIKELGGDTNRGLRAAKYLRRMEALDDRQVGLAARLRAPLIDAFLYERITTDGLDIATKRIMQADDPEAVVTSIIRELHRREAQEEQPDAGSPQEQAPSPKKDALAPDIRRSEKLSLAIRRFRQFTSLIGDQPPSVEERRVLTNMREEIDALLTR